MAHATTGNQNATVSPQHRSNNNYAPRGVWKHMSDQTRLSESTSKAYAEQFLTGNCPDEVQLAVDKLEEAYDTNWVPLGNDEDSTTTMPTSTISNDRITE